MAEVAIIIPSHNSAPWLAATVQSALDQTRPAAEIIVIDDGSTDETPAVCARFDSRVRVERQENCGVSAARNHGARLASAEWLVFLDSDDRLLPHALEALLRSALEREAGVSYGMVIWRREPPQRPQLQSFDFAEGDAPAPALANFWRSAIATPGAAAVRRDIHERIGGFIDGWQPMEDRDYWIKAGVCTRFAFCDTVVLDKTWRRASAGSQTERRIVSGMRAQLAFLDWCGGRQIDTAFLRAGPRDIIDRAIKDALWERCPRALPGILETASLLGIRTRWMLRARLQSLLPRLPGGRTKP